MPSHTAASALIMLYFMGGHPWDWPVWQEITGIKHGLFPADDKLLPKGWSREDASDILSYFNQFNECDTDDSKSKFASSVAKKGAAAVPGRKLWTDFVSKNWKKWGVHDLVVQCLRKHDSHPIDILVKSRSLDSWPKSDFYIPKAIDSIGLMIFGVECFGDGNSILYQFQKPLSIFAQRSWARIRESVRKDQRRLAELEQKAMKAFEDLATGKYTKKKVIATIQSVSKWRDIATIYGTPENIAKVDDMLAEVNRIMEALGAEVPKSKPGSGKRLSKVNLKMLQSLATTEDLLKLMCIYAEYFAADNDDDQPIISSKEGLSFRLQDVEGGDLGMEEEAQLDPDMLALRVGFIRQRLPHQFINLRHKTGLTAWENAHLFKGSHHPDYLVPLKLHWHQLAGVHSIARSVFTSTPRPDHCTGMLICDEVGLGKTALCISTMAFLNQVVVLQAKKEPLPPVLENRAYLKGSDSVEALPHLIVAPGTLRAQWIQELKTLFLPKSVDIFLYDSPKAGNPDFWNPDGPFYTSKQDPQNKIIVTTHSSLQNEFQSCYTWPTNRSDRPWENVAAKPAMRANLFQQRFLSVTIDEIHEMRNLGPKHYAALSIMKKGTVKLALTGTPLVTSPKDLAVMGRLVGVSHFFTESAVEEAKEDTAALRRARKMDDDGLSVQTVQIKSVKRMQGQFRGSVLRRTTDSRNWQGQTLLDLLPHKDIIGVLNLTEREKAIIEARAEDAKRDAKAGNESGRFTTRKFYLEYRVAVSYAKADPEGPNPVFQSLEEWYPVKSTKMDVCARICQYYLSRDDVLDVEFVDGEPKFTEMPTPAPGQVVSQNRKLLIFSEFPSMTPLLRNVLSLYKIKSLFIDGTMPYDRRDKIVADFQFTPGSPRVFIFSSVGSAGLNLSIADVVIFFDQPWSAQDERQIRGRAHRQPQKAVVKAIHLLANNSSDVLINNMARGKKIMFDTFVNNDLGEMQDILSGKALENEDGDLDDVQPEAEEEKAGGKRRRPARGSKKKGVLAKKPVVEQASNHAEEPATREPSTASIGASTVTSVKKLAPDFVEEPLTTSTGATINPGVEETNAESTAIQDCVTGLSAVDDLLDMNDDAARVGSSLGDSNAMQVCTDFDAEEQGADSSGVSDGVEGLSFRECSMAGTDDDHDLSNGSMEVIHVESASPSEGYSSDYYYRRAMNASPPVPSPDVQTEHVDSHQDQDSDLSSQDSPCPKRRRARSLSADLEEMTTLFVDQENYSSQQNNERPPSPMMSQNNPFLEEESSSSSESRLRRYKGEGVKPQHSSETSLPKTLQEDRTKPSSQPHYLVSNSNTPPRKGNPFSRPTFVKPQSQNVAAKDMPRKNPFSRPIDVSQEQAPDERGTHGSNSTLPQRESQGLRPDGKRPLSGLATLGKNSGLQNGAEFSEAPGQNRGARPGTATSAGQVPIKAKVSHLGTRRAQFSSKEQDSHPSTSGRVLRAPPEHRQMAPLEDQDRELSPPRSSSLVSFIRKQRSGQQHSQRS